MTFSKRRHASRRGFIRSASYAAAGAGLGRMPSLKARPASPVARAGRGLLYSPPHSLVGCAGPQVPSFRVAS